MKSSCTVSATCSWRATTIFATIVHFGRARGFHRGRIDRPPENPAECLSAGFEGGKAKNANGSSCASSLATVGDLRN